MATVPSSSMFNRALLERSNRCGCFHCLAIYSPSEIVEWTDETDAAPGQTAICPRCGVDAVVPETSERSLDTEQLRTLRRDRFGM